MRVLVVDDNPGDLRLVALALEPEGIEVVPALDAEQALAAMERWEAGGGLDAVLLDVQLPGRSGLELLADLRARGLRLPILLLTGHDDEGRAVEGLGLGADDYVTKPFRDRELAARVLRHVRRGPGRRSRWGDLVLDRKNQAVFGPEGEIHVSPDEFHLLFALLRRAGEPASRAELALEVWHRPQEEVEHSIDLTIARLRERLHGRSRTRIENLRGRGWRLAHGRPHRDRG